VLEQSDLFLGELDLALGRRLLEPQQPLVLGEQTVALPHPAHAAGGHLQALEPQFLLDPHRSMAGMGERVVEDRLLDLGRDPIEMRASGAGQAI
jgi:hypothetical protein